jgi:hypothetical protein
MPINDPRLLPRSFVLFFASEGDQQAYVGDTAGHGTGNAVISGPGWVMVTNIRGQYAAAVNAGGEVVTEGTLFDQS